MMEDDDEEEPQADHHAPGRNQLPHPASTPTATKPKMPTELPYAADAEDSLSYDELQVRLLSLKWRFVGCADVRSFRSSASNTRRRYRSRM